MIVSAEFYYLSYISSHYNPKMDNNPTKIKNKKCTKIEFHKKIKIKNLYMKINAASEGDIGMKCTMAHNLTLPRYHLLQLPN